MVEVQIDMVDIMIEVITAIIFIMENSLTFTRMVSVY